jgi:hypothetical protein
MKFSYEGHDKMGRPLKGDLEASNQEAAAAELRAMGVFAMRLEQAGEEPMKTVLEHKESVDQRFVPPDAGTVEDEIEKVVQEGSDIDACSGIEADVLRAVEIAKEIRSAVQKDVPADMQMLVRPVGFPQYPDYVYGECLKEMLAEIAVRRFACCKSCR